MTVPGSRFEVQEPRLAVSKKCKFTAEYAENAEATCLSHKTFSATSAVKKTFSNFIKSTMLL